MPDGPFTSFRHREGHWKLGLVSDDQDGRVMKKTKYIAHIISNEAPT